METAGAYDDRWWEEFVEVEPPENELRKGLGGGVGGLGSGTGGRTLSEHQLRVQRSLQRLHVPDWYKNSPAPGFLLRRASADAHHWPGLQRSAAASLSSLGPSQGASLATSPAPTPSPGTPQPTLAAHSPTGGPLRSAVAGALLSPGAGAAFSRWSTSRLSSAATSASASASTSPAASARSSFNYRQPYLGWRSQERLSRPRTPAERLAAGLLADKVTGPAGAGAAGTGTSPIASPVGAPGTPGALAPAGFHTPIAPHTSRPGDADVYDEMPQVPNLSEVRTSIKEVTSAIVHYVSGVRDGSSEALSPHRDQSGSPRSISPRGSGRLCWLESSFVGSRPLDSPETPLSLTGSDPASKLGDLYLDLNKSQGFSQLNGYHRHEEHRGINKFGYSWQQIRHLGSLLL